MEPSANCRTFINQAGVVVRDNVPISIPDLHKPKNAGDEEALYVSDVLKDFLWDSLMTHFNLPENITEGMRMKVKAWTLQQMAKQFQTWKKKLWAKYEKEDPVFTGRLEKIKDH